MALGLNETGILFGGNPETVSYLADGGGGVGALAKAGEDVRDDAGGGGGRGMATAVDVLPTA